ncbi:unnamed protein product [Malus baccata var. baccata]
MYKVCYSIGCRSGDILVGLNWSAFVATKRGILVSHGIGKSSNEALSFLIVGANEKLNSYDTVLGDALAPRVAFFLSRRPSRTSPTILKPNIIEPDVKH